MIRKGIIFLGASCFMLHSNAQSELSFDVEAAPGYEFNIYNAPEIYILSNGDTLGRNDLIADDGFMSFEANTEWSWKKNKQELSADLGLELLRYFNTPSANATEVQSYLKYDNEVWENLNWGAYLRLRSQSRLGLNVLGSELLTPFSFRQIEFGMNAEIPWKGGHATVLEANYSEKDYDKCANCGLNGENVSLSQGEVELEVIQEFITGKIGKEDQKLMLSFRFRNRNYREWFNYDVLDENAGSLAEDPFLPFDPNYDYPLRNWCYYIFKAEYLFPMNERLKMKPSIEYTSRQDLSDGDFGFKQFQPGMFLYYSDKNWSGRLYLSYTSRDYTDRLARQETGVPYPNLEYRYIRTSLRIERKLENGLGFWAKWTLANRDSNTSLLSTRVRRSYNNTAMMLGVSWEIAKDLKKRK